MTAGRVLVELRTVTGHGRWRERVVLDAQGGFVLGRGLDAALVVDDPHVAAAHARVEVGAGGEVWVSDLGSVNGVIVAGERHHAVTRLAAPDGEFRIGRTLVRVRAPGQAVAPERRDHSAAYMSRATHGMAVALAIACAGYVVYLNWMGAPQDLVATSVTSLLLLAGVAGVWVGAWALLSRMLLGEWRGILHVAILFGAAFGCVVVANVLDLAWFSFDLPAWEPRYVLPPGIALMIVLFAHLRHATHLARGHTAIVAVLLPAVLVGGGLWVQWRSEVRDVNHIGHSERIFPPAFRLAGATAPDAFFARLARLQDAADARREALEAEDENAAAERPATAPPAAAAR